MKYTMQYCLTSNVPSSEDELILTEHIQDFGPVLWADVARQVPHTGTFTSNGILSQFLMN